MHMNKNKLTVCFLEQFEQTAKKYENLSVQLAPKQNNLTVKHFFHLNFHSMVFRGKASICGLSRLAPMNDSRTISDCACKQKWIIFKFLKRPEKLGSKTRKLEITKASILIGNSEFNR